MAQWQFITLDDASSSPFYQQIYEAPRLSILNGRIASRTQVPPTRVLAGELGVSRTTVVNAYDQLVAEGYLEGKTGAGTFVASELPDATSRLEPTVSADRKAQATRRERVLSRRGEWIASSSLKSLRMQADNACLAFQNGVPAVNEFPFRVWWRLASRRWRNPPRELLGYGDPAGYPPLREAIAEHLRSARAVNCDPDQVIIVAHAASSRSNRPALARTW
jgi:GntR family transcriptional regulator / MocR family aminotransferase